MSNLGPGGDSIGAADGGQVGPGGTGPDGDLPEAAARRLGGGYTAYTSGLNVSELAACEHMGMRPVGLVQGFCVMGWNFYSSITTTGYLRPMNTIRTYSCPHPSYLVDSEHRSYGWNDQDTTIEETWGEGYNRAYSRMIEEAGALGAHGVIGVTDATQPLLGSGVREFHLYGTAVVFENAPPPQSIWSTYLAGPRLGKLFEAGLLPVSVIASIAAVRIYAYCVTEMLERGQWDNYIDPGSEIVQLSDAHTSARELARTNLKRRLGGDELHGADLSVVETHQWGLPIIMAELRGTRVRRFRDVEPLAAPTPTVRMIG